MKSRKIWLIVGLVVGWPLPLTSTMDWRAKGLSTPPFFSGLYLSDEILVGSIDGYIGPLFGSSGKPMMS